MKIKVSIIIPVYNQQDLLLKALNSIPKRDDIEVIICDDCSNDNSYEVANYYLDNSKLNVKLFHNDINRGVGYSRNICLDNCSGEYIFGLDSDDSLITDKWEYVVDNYLDSINDLVRISRRENSGNILSGGYAFHTYFVKRSVIENLRCENCNHAEDYFLFKKFIKNVKKEVHSNVVAYNYNYPREGSLSNIWERDNK